jgi:hypothetical protein
MTVKASAGATLILAAGLLAGLAGSPPTTAAAREAAATAKSEDATSGKSIRHSSRYLKKRYAHRKNGRVTSKPAETRKATETEVADASGSTTPPIPEAVTNANAQMLSAYTAQDRARESARAMSEAMSGKGDKILMAATDQPTEPPAAAESGVVAADQLNDVDRALQQPAANPPAPAQTVAMAQPKPAQEVKGSDSLDKTSLIGKIFIACGALLTMASAARMFMA